MSTDGEGGFVKTLRNEDSRRRFRPQRRETRDTLKTGDDLAAEHRVARQRWASVPPLVVAREMIAEANLTPELLGQVSAVISEMSGEQLAEFVNSGELDRQLAEFATG